MVIKINENKDVEKLEIQINCKDYNDEVKALVDFLESRIIKIQGIKEEIVNFINIRDIFYIESVDKKSFMYTKNEVYEIKERLYRIENNLRNKGFIRISKNTIVNLIYVSNVKVKINKRLILTLENSEKLIVSRSYVDDFKRELKM